MEYAAHHFFNDKVPLKKGKFTAEAECIKVVCGKLLKADRIVLAHDFEISVYN